MMAHNYRQGFFKPHRPEKYVGNQKIVYRSSWELRVMRYLDQEPNILKWSSEELAIPYISPLDNKPHRYFPDFSVQLKTTNGTIKNMIWEVKPKSQSVLPKPRKVTKKYITEVATYAVNEAKWIAAREFCARHGMEFMVLTEHDLFGKAAK